MTRTAWGCDMASCKTRRQSRLRSAERSGPNGRAGRGILSIGRDRFVVNAGAPVTALICAEEQELHPDP